MQLSLNSVIDFRMGSALKRLACLSKVKVIFEVNVKHGWILHCQLQLLLHFYNCEICVIVGSQEIEKLRSRSGSFDEIALKGLQLQADIFCC